MIDHSFTLEQNIRLLFVGIAPDALEASSDPEELAEVLTSCLDYGLPVEQLAEFRALVHPQGHELCLKIVKEYV